MNNEFYSLPRERVFEELRKALLKGVKPSVFFNFLREIGVLPEMMPELNVLIGIEQGVKHHSEGDVYNHTMLALDSIPLERRDLATMLAILVHDFGKAIVKAEPDGDAVHFYGHGEAVEAPARAFLDRLTAEIAVVEEVIMLAKLHMIPFAIKDNLHKSSVRRLALKVDFVKLMDVHRADELGRGVPKDVAHIDRMLAMFESIKSEIKPLVMGRHLIEIFGMKPSAEFGAVLKRAFEAQLDGVFGTLEDGLAFVRKELGK
jgi:tRNA nucleotidyltransferase (CCA-adding enzyme)